MAYWEAADLVDYVVSFKPARPSRTRHPSSLPQVPHRTDCQEGWFYRVAFHVLTQSQRFPPSLSLDTSPQCLSEPRGGIPHPAPLLVSDPRRWPLGSPSQQALTSHHHATRRCHAARGSLDVKATMCGRSRTDCCRIKEDHPHPWNRTRNCSKRFPHAAHVVARCQRIREGWLILVVFCVGQPTSLTKAALASAQ